MILIYQSEQISKSDLQTFLAIHNLLGSLNLFRDIRTNNFCKQIL